jgi:hypothetical protein
MRYEMIVVLCGLGVAGCAVSQAGHQAGRGAAAGALSEVKEQAQHPEQGPPPLEIASRNIVIGALDELNRPNRQAQLAQIIAVMTQGGLASAAGKPPAGYGWGGGPSNVNPPSIAPAPSFSADAFPIAALGGKFSEGFTLGMSKQLQSELGPNGDGPLAKTLAAVTEQMSGAAANGIAQGLTPALGDCGGADRNECTDRRVQQLGRSAAVGFAQGLGSTMKIPFLVAGFFVGILVAFAIFGFVRLVRPRATA